MKRTLLALLLICMLGMLSGCKPSNIESSKKNTETKHKETEISSEIETDTPIRYELTQYKPTSNIGHTLDLVAFDTKIYAILKRADKNDIIKSNINPYYLVSFDKNGNNFTQVNLETPVIENELIQLKHFSIGQDQRIYALKIDYIPESGAYNTPTLERNLRLVCWNLDGSLHNDIPLTITDIEPENPDSTYVTNISISQNGTILLCCNTHGKPSSIICLSPDGTIHKIVKGESQHKNVLFNKNNDGTLFAIQAEYEKGEISHSYYLGYDASAQEFLPAILLKNIHITSADMEGNHEVLYFIQDDGFYNYYLETQEKHLLIDLAYNNLPGFRTILLVAENTYICTYISNSIYYIGFLKQIS